jgi:glucose/mannose transport system substrate-binding protein
MKTKMLKPVAAALLAGFGLLGVAHAQKAEVIHWWTSGGEAAAIKEFSTMYTKQGGTWQDNPIAGGGGGAARTVIINRMQGGDPPTAAQFNYSNQYREAINAGLLNNLDDLAKKENWDTALPDSIKTSIKVDGHYYAVPVNLHMPFWVWSNKDVLAKAGVTKDPQNLAEVIAAMDQVKAKLPGVVPMALGGQSWQENILFRGVMLADGGKDLWLKVHKDKDLSGKEFRKTLEDFKKLKAYVDPGSPGRDWNLATGMVIEGKAAFQFMGDWAKGEFVNAGKVNGKDFGCTLVAGPTTPYIIGGDVFVFPKSDKPGVKEAQAKLAAMMYSKEGQVAFNNKKGSIPIRTDVDLTKVDSCAAIGVKALKERRLLEAHEQFLAPDAVGAFEDAVSKFWNSDQSVDDALKAMQVAVKR